MTVWQIAAGDSGGRNYTDLFLEYDTMLIGPGDMGNFDTCPSAYDIVRPRMVSQIRSFVYEPMAGDVVLLRHGHSVEAVGAIPPFPNAGYQWMEQFADVLGWDLQHVRRVLWNKSAVSHLAHLQPVFGNYKQQSTFTRVLETRITSLENQLSTAVHQRIEGLRQLPDSVGVVLSTDDFGTKLFSAGLSNDAVDRVTQTVSRIKRLSQWYSSTNTGRPSEHEIVAHMINPLMQGMGWSEQLLAIEWKKIDMAFFRSAETSEDNCVMICEAKRPNQSLTGAYSQALEYVKSRNLRNCKRIVTTDGTRLLLYKRDPAGNWSDKPSGYVNLTQIRDKNVFPIGTSGIETLIELVPWNAMQ